MFFQDKLEVNQTKIKHMTSVYSTPTPWSIIKWIMLSYMLASYIFIYILIPNTERNLWKVIHLKYKRAKCNIIQGSFIKYYILHLFIILMWFFETIIWCLQNTNTRMNTILYWNINEYNITHKIRVAIIYQVNTTHSSSLYI